MSDRMDEIFFADGLDAAGAARAVDETLRGADDGELFLESRRSEMLALDDGRVKTASFDASCGFGLRAVAGEAVGYAHASEMSAAALARAGETVRAVLKGHSGRASEPPRATNRRLYADTDPIGASDIAEKIACLREIDAYLRRDPRVRQVATSLAGSWQAVAILRPDAPLCHDIRPLVRLNIQVIVEADGRRESGSSGSGGRTSYDAFLTPAHIHAEADEALRQALVNLDAKPAPAGEMPVVLGPGWPGILLHEAVGHGLEGDFHRKKTSAFTGREGTRVAARGITVVDDATLEGRRGSLSVDDEGTPGARTVLIEDGILKGCMQDRMNARLMGAQPTGNARRESFAHMPMPRMTNTFMLNGAHDPEEIRRSVKRGVYAPYFGGGQVDITSGKFVFSCTEAYEIEDGRIGRPLKGAMLIGDGPEALTRATMVGNDMALDPGIGTCGKNGQGVPVGVGQPTLLISSLTVGGTEA